MSLPKANLVCLDLREGNSDSCVDDVHGVVSGSLDDFPERPEGYARVILPMNRAFLRWPRWYLQCFAHQLGDGGLLILVPTGETGGQASGGKARCRQMLSSARWSLLFRFPRLAACMAPKWLLEMADRYRLRPIGGSKDQPRHTFGLSKEARANEVNDSELEARFEQYFGSWCENGIPLPNGPEVTQAGLLCPQAEAGKVLVLSPHPDDELIGCGGTVLELQKLGLEIHVIHFSEGYTSSALREQDEETRRTVRWNETRKVSERLGFNTEYWPTGSGGKIRMDEEVVDRLAEVLKQMQPEIIFVPAETDLHLEHQIVQEIYAKAVERFQGAGRAFEYPVWGFLSAPSHAVDVSGSYSNVLNTLYLYRTAMKAEDYVSRCDVLTLWLGRVLGGEKMARMELFREIK